MKTLTLESRGFSVFEFVIAIVLLCALVGAGYFVASRQGTDKQDSSASSKQPVKVNDQAVVWAFDEREQQWYVQSGKAPKCENGAKFEYSPVDFSQVEMILLPGQYRGYNYKPHGGFGLAAATAGQTEVKMPIGGTIIGLTRYIEGPDNALQYLVTFVNDCGLEIKFDHLAVLSPRLQAIAETRPPAKQDDTRSDPNNKPKPELFKAGEVIATTVGHPNIQNFGFDFGITDYRKRNQISENPEWTALHEVYTASEWYGVCWFDKLPGDDAEKAKGLSEKVVNPAKPNVVSDYCKHIKTKTLDVNNGKPTDG